MVRMSLDNYLRDQENADEDGEDETQLSDDDNEPNLEPFSEDEQSDQSDNEGMGSILCRPRSSAKPKVLTMADIKNFTHADKPVTVSVKLCDGTEARISTTTFAAMSLIKSDTDVYTTFEK